MGDQVQQHNGQGSSKRSTWKRWKLLARLPLFIRAPLVRRMFAVPQNLPSGLVFKKAETFDEIEQAFRVAFDAFHERGLVSDNKGRLRVTKFHALPTTNILIAKLNDEVIATMTVVVDSAMGLPLEKLFDIQDIRNRSVRMAEISTLAIKASHRSQRGQLLLPLCNFMYRLCRQYLGVDVLVAAVHPAIQDFYRCILLFQDINNAEVKTYDFVQGAEAVASWLNIAELPANYIKVYGNKKPERNLYNFFVHQPFPQFQFPDQSKFVCSDFNYTPSILDYFFRSKSDVMDSLTLKEKEILANSYFHTEYRDVISGSEEGSQLLLREQARFSVFYKLSFHFQGANRIYIGHVLEASRQGLKIVVHGLQEKVEGQEVVALVEIPNHSPVLLGGEVAWYHQASGRMGIRMKTFIPKAWLEQIYQFEIKLSSLVSSHKESLSLQKKSQS